MSKPEDIPQDVWEEALALVRSLPGSMTVGEIAARAVMASKAEEREACALVADEEARKRGNHDMQWQARIIRNAIRSRP